MTMGERIKKAREAKGYSQTELAHLLGYKSRSSINKIETQGRDIPRSSIVEFSKVLGVTPSYLMGWDEEDKKGNEPIDSNATILPQDNVHIIPIYESVSAGFGAYADDYIVGYMPLYIVNEEEAKNTMCIVVSGDSMYPKIENGDKIQVLRQDWAEDGQVVVALIDGENGVVKKIKYSDDKITLVSFNPEYQPREFVGAERDRIRILGIVKTVIKSL
ncbi:helix-turn-helix domain-containing protein [Ruminococcus sp.]|uniref:helix-turn-helix domain-containing protein n=1 Tax=Ruminococcus sp. TaxID=41978 RepID=UPI003AB2BA02